MQINLLRVQAIFLNFEIFFYNNGYNALGEVRSQILGSVAC